MKAVLFASVLMILFGPALTTVASGDKPFSAAPRNVPVTVIRDGGFGERGAGARLRVNGREIGTLLAGDKLTFYVAPGRVVFGVGAWDREKQFSQIISAGDMQRFRIEALAGNRFAFSRVRDFAR